MVKPQLRLLCSCSLRKVEKVGFHLLVAAATP